MREENLFKHCQRGRKINAKKKVLTSQRIKLVKSSRSAKSHKNVSRCEHKMSFLHFAECDFHDKWKWEHFNAHLGVYDNEKKFFFLFFQTKVKVSLSKMKKVKCRSHPLVHLAIHLNFLFLCVRRIFCRLDRAIKIIFVLPFSPQFGYKTVTSMTCLRSANFLLWFPCWQCTTNRKHPSSFSVIKIHCICSLF